MPPQTLVWAVGDIHGRADLLEPVLNRILDDCRSSAARSMVIFLGDYIDRGPASSRVLEILTSVRADPSLDARFLCGNHEAALLEILQGKGGGDTWYRHGGRELLLAYGLRKPAHSNSRAWASLGRDLALRIPSDQIALLRSLDFSITVGDYFFSHAGARPGVSLKRQHRKDLLWIRETFTESKFQFDKVVVHGHTRTENVYIDDRRIGLDTGAYETGVLSALRLWNDERHVLQTVSESGRVGINYRAITV